MKRLDEETGKEYTCCHNQEYEQWTDDCGGRYCSLRKIKWCEWFNEDACADCELTCEGDWD